MKITTDTLKVLSFSFFLLISMSVMAQSNCSIQGTIADHNGESLPGAIIRISAEKAQVSSANGSYRFLDLPPAEYTLHISMTGFKKIEKTVALSSGKELHLNFKMEQASSGGEGFPLE